MASWSKSDRLIDKDPITGHVTKSKFGTETDHLEALIAFTERVGPVKDWDIPYFMAAFYDAAYKISERCYNAEFEIKKFTEATNPLRLVSMNTKEGLMESNRYRKRFNEFITYEVAKLTGMSFPEWIALPTYMLEQLLDDLRTGYMIREQERARMMGTIDEVPKDRHESAIEKMVNGSAYNRK